MKTWATFNDGQTARRQDVEIQITRSTLVIRDQAGAELGGWPIAEIAAVDDGPVQGILRLRRLEDKGARLAVSDPDSVATLIALSPNLSKRRGGWARARRVGLLVGLCAGILAMLFVVILPRSSTLLARFVPVQWEEALGRHVGDQIVEMIGAFSSKEQLVCHTQAGEAALQRLTDRLTAATATPYTYHVTVLDVGLVNAFALPGGYIFLFRGLLEDASSPNEVAGVLAHEMAHVIHRHGTEALIRDTGASLIFNALLGNVGQGIGETLVGFSYSREAELEADRTAVTLLKAAEIEVAGLADFFRQIELEGGDLPLAFSFLSTHPPSGARAALIEQNKGLGGDPGMDANDWRALKAICAP